MLEIDVGAAAKAATVCVFFWFLLSALVHVDEGPKGWHK